MTSSSELSNESHENAIGLLKKTIEFLHSEYSMHFVVLSSYQIADKKAVIGYSSPGAATDYLSHDSTASLREWNDFCSGCDFKNSSSSTSFNSHIVYNVSTNSNTNISSPPPKKCKPSAILAIAVENMLKKAEKNNNIDVKEEIDLSSNINSVLDLSCHSRSSDNSNSRNGISQSSDGIFSSDSLLTFVQNQQAAIMDAASDFKEITEEQVKGNGNSNKHLLKIVHPTDDVSWMCTICKKTMKKKCSYRHMKEVHAFNKETVQCPICARSFTRRYTLVLHCRNVHPQSNVSLEGLSTTTSHFNSSDENADDVSMVSRISNKNSIRTVNNKFSIASFMPTSLNLEA